MMCNSPIYLRKYNILVPCRKCRACKMARVAEWSLRLQHELTYHKSATFLTLTYAPEYLPDGCTIVKSDLQKFFKLLRYHLGKSNKIKYFACGEYGDHTWRPHYHAIVFGLRLIKDRDIVNKSWPNGHVHYGSVTSKSINYVCSYVSKKLYGDAKFAMYEDRGLLSPFQLVSQGMGLNFAVDNNLLIRTQLKLQLDGKIRGVPRYYRDKLGIDAELFRKTAIECNEKAVEKIALAYSREFSTYATRQGCLPDDVVMEQFADFMLAMRIRPRRERELEAKEGLFSRQKI